MSLTKFDTADKINPTKEEQTAIDTFIKVFGEHANQEDVPLSYGIEDEDYGKTKYIIADWYTYLNEELNAQKLVDEEKKNYPDEDYYDIACYLSEILKQDYISMVSYYGNEILSIAKETNRRLEAMGSPIRVYSPKGNEDFVEGALEYFNVYYCDSPCDTSTYVWIVSKEELEQLIRETKEEH